MRLLPLTAAALAGVALAGVAFAGCGAANGAGNRATIPLAEVSRRYQAAVEPAHAAQSAVITEALAFNGGSPAKLAAAARRSEPAVRDAAPRVRAIAARQPLRRDITDVATALDAVAGDLSALAGASGSAVQPDIARLVADAGRESAADALVKLALNAATTPTTLPPATVAPPTTTTVPPATSTTTGKHTPTTRARTSTTVARPTTTTIKH